METIRAAIRITLRRDVTTRGIRVALIVGTLLVLINHGDTLLLGHWSLREGIKIILTYAVPYGVSTYASVASIRKMEGERRRNL